MRTYTLINIFIKAVTFVKTAPVSVGPFRIVYWRTSTLTFLPLMIPGNVSANPWSDFWGSGRSTTYEWRWIFIVPSGGPSERGNVFNLQSETAGYIIYDCSRLTGVLSGTTLPLHPVTAAKRKMFAQFACGGCHVRK